MRTPIPPTELADLPESLRAKLARARVPDDFHFGAATAAFQIEGGYNGPGEPRNNWFDWERTGKVEPSGIAVDSWNRWADDQDAVVAFGGGAYRFGIDWARVQPTGPDHALDRLPESANPPFDEEAVTTYVAMIARAQERGLEPYLTLHHFTHPRWLPDDLWLRPDSPELFGAYVARIVPMVNAGLAAAGARPVVRYITINEINVLATQTFFTGLFPGARRPGDRAGVVAAVDHLTAAHVKAYDAIHQAHAEAGWPAPLVTTNTFDFSNYELERGILDHLLARRHGVARSELSSWVRSRRRDWYARLERLAGPFDAAEERAFNAALGRMVPVPLPVTADAVYASPFDGHLDAVSTDFYAPWAKGRFRVPGHRTVGGRNWLPGRMLWDDPPMPASFVAFQRAHAEDGLPVWVVENGLCNRVIRGVAHARWDGYTRVRYLKEHLAHLGVAVSEGLGVTAYLHWCLYDNYEWGDYGMRFGIHGVDRERGTKRLALDSMGGDAAGTYRACIGALRTGEGSDSAFT